MKTFQMKKNKKSAFLSFWFSLLCLVAIIFPCMQHGITFADTYAEEFISHTVSDGYFSATMSAKSRKNNILEKNQQIVENYVGEEIDFFVFKWSQLASLEFKITSNITYVAQKFSNFSFLLTAVQSDDLKVPLSQATPNYKPTTETLYQTNITNNRFTTTNFLYHTDSNANITESEIRCRGKDFGLFKFDFRYSYLDGEETRTISFGDIYVAIVPDEVDKIDPKDTKIFYSVSSSNKLMNIFNLYLSTDLYKYVNPNYLQWKVVGEDIENYQYILTQKMKDASPIEYSNYKPIWQSLAKTTGNNFVFDSNDIEGTWTVYCTIRVSEKNANKKDIVLMLEDLSTIKEQKSSYWWIIIIIIAIILLISVIIAFVIHYKRKEKVW